MAFLSLVPTTVVLDTIEQGEDWVRTFTVRDAQGSPIDMSEYNATPPTSEFRDKAASDGGLKDDLPQPTCAWIVGTTVPGDGGQFTMTLANAATAAAAKFSYVFDVECTHSGGKITKSFKGSGSISKEVTTGT